MIDEVNKKEEQKFKKYLAFFKGIIFKYILLLILIIGSGYFIIYQTNWLSAGKISNEIKNYKKAIIDIEEDNKKVKEEIKLLNIKNENFKKEISSYLLSATELSVLKTEVENLFFERKITILAEDIFMAPENEWWKILTIKMDVLLDSPEQTDQITRLLEEKFPKKIRIKEINYQTSNHLSLWLEFYFF